ncbi:MAG TPA: hypothetical protein VM370_05545, partial [Candidatus Thermoplasmatota archaeon]|nr:hypothetical protein [Candidatus Thermoplasmatota archaeon]
MTNQFRIDESELRGWHQTLAARLDVRGVPAIAKEIEAHLFKKEPDGTVVVTRHQLFTWAEALQGAAARAGPEIGAVANQMGEILRGKASGGGSGSGGGSAFVPPTAAAIAPSMFAGAPPPSGYQAPSALYTPPPPVQYGAPAAASGGARVVTGRELGELARDLVRSARSELYVSSPWDTGLETLVADITMLAPTVRVLVVSRRPAQDGAAFHAAMDQLGRRRAVTVFSPYVQTRLVIQDGERALVGAASVPGPASREAALLVTDRATVAALRTH